MPSLYYYLDMRTPAKDGTGSLKLAFTHKHDTSYVPIGTRVRPGEWNRERQQVVERDDKKFLNVLIKKRMAEATLALQRIMLRDDFDTLDAKHILYMIVRGTDTADSPEVADYVLPVYNEYITLCKKPNTAACYRTSLNNLKAYEPKIDTLRFKDLTVSWLRKYARWLTEERGMETNGANVYLRNLRTVFNYAVKNDFTKARYPFKDIDMTTTEPNKWEIPFDLFIRWLCKPMKDNRQFYRDLFMLSFYLCGIRPVDLLHVKKDQVEDGRLVYWPEKLNGRTKLSIKIEPEAAALIKKYEGKDHLIRIMDERTDYKSFMAHWNRALKAIGEDYIGERVGRKSKRYMTKKHIGIIPKISTYYARILWSTYAYNLIDAPMDVISQALGHKSGLRVTNFYVKRDAAKVDKANRQLIDLVNQAVADFHE